MHYREAGSGTPLVLLHATPKSSRSYKALIPYLADHHRVITPDTLGFGESDPLPENITLSMLADSVADLIEELNSVPAAVFGLHTGNKIGAALAAGHPDKVSRFILCGMTHSIILDRAEREAAIKTLVGKPFTRTDISDDEKRDREKGAASTDAIYSVNFDFDMAATLRTLSMPTLVIELITAEESHLGQHAENVAAQIPQGLPSAFPGSDRDALDQQPDKLADLILDLPHMNNRAQKDRFYSMFTTARSVLE